MTREEILDELKKVLAPYTSNKEMLNSINDQTDLISDLKIKWWLISPLLAEGILFGMGRYWGAGC